MADPRLAGRATLPPAIREQLPRVLNRLRASLTTSIYQKATRARSRDRAVQELTGLLAKVVADDVIQLRHCRVFPATGRVEVNGGKRTTIRPGEIATLRYLLEAGDAGLTTTALSIQRDLSLDAATKSVMRLREAIGNDLHANRQGSARSYSVSAMRE